MAIASSTRLPAIVRHAPAMRLLIGSVFWGACYVALGLHILWALGVLFGGG